VTPRKSPALPPLTVLLLTVSLLIGSTAACAATTYDTSISTQTVAPTTTVLPVGSALDLLPELVTAAAGLSALIAEQGDKLAVVERMEALWAAVHDEVVKGDRDLATEIEAEIAKARASATFNRPGAADKAFRNLSALVKAYLAGA
jgi:hypothetical protein